MKDDEEAEDQGDQLDLNRELFDKDKKKKKSGKLDTMYDWRSKDGRKSFGILRFVTPFNDLMAVSFSREDLLRMLDFIDNYPRTDKNGVAWVNLNFRKDKGKLQRQKFLNGYISTFGTDALYQEPKDMKKVWAKLDEDERTDRLSKQIFEPDTHKAKGRPMTASEEEEDELPDALKRNKKNLDNYDNDSEGAYWLDD